MQVWLNHHLATYQYIHYDKISIYFDLISYIKCDSVMYIILLEPPLFYSCKLLLFNIIIIIIITSRDDIQPSTVVSDQWPCESLWGHWNYWMQSNLQQKYLQTGAWLDL